MGFNANLFWDATELAYLLDDFETIVDHERLQVSATKLGVSECLESFKIAVVLKVEHEINKSFAANMLKDFIENYNTNNLSSWFKEYYSEDDLYLDSFRLAVVKLWMNQEYSAAYLLADDIFTNRTTRRSLR